MTLPSRRQSLNKYKNNGLITSTIVVEDTHRVLRECITGRSTLIWGRGRHPQWINFRAEKWGTSRPGRVRGLQTGETAWGNVLRQRRFEWPERRQWAWYTGKQREPGVSRAWKGRQVLHLVKYLGHLPKSDGRPMKTLEREWHVQNYLFNQSL